MPVGAKQTIRGCRDFDSGPPAPASEIGRDQFVRAFAGAHVDFHGGRVDQFEVRIERTEQPGLVASQARLDSPQRIFIDEKCSLHRAVMPPKTHGPPRRVVGSASIGKIKRHDPDTLLEPTCCPPLISVGAVANRGCNGCDDR